MPIHANPVAAHANAPLCGIPCAILQLGQSSVCVIGRKKYYIEPVHWRDGYGLEPFFLVDTLF